MKRNGPANDIGYVPVFLRLVKCTFLEKAQTLAQKLPLVPAKWYFVVALPIQGAAQDAFRTLPAHTTSREDERSVAL